MAAKKKTSKKTTTKKASKKTAKKAPVTKKKVASKKKVAKKTAAKKTTTKKKTTSKKTSAKKTTSKTTTKKVPVKEKVAAKKATKKIIEDEKPINAPSTVEFEHGFPAYVLTDGEEYMSDGQLEHFKNILEHWKQQLMDEVDRTVDHMREDASNFADPADRATQEEEFGLELRTRDRERKLVRKINAALFRIEDGSYGYCDETGEEIGLRRLEARPVATLCLEAQERREKSKRLFRDHEDVDR